MVSFKKLFLLFIISIFNLLSTLFCSPVTWIHYCDLQFSQDVQEAIFDADTLKEDRLLAFEKKVEEERAKAKRLGNEIKEEKGPSPFLYPKVYGASFNDELITTNPGMSNLSVWFNDWTIHLQKSRFRYIEFVSPIQWSTNHHEFRCVFNWSV